MTAKEEVIEIVKDLPESVSLGEIGEHLQILAAVREGDRAFEEGRFKTHEQAQALLNSWVEKWKK
jgi:predicted transcriptional regulator